MDLEKIPLREMQDCDKWFNKFLDNEIKAWKKIRKEVKEETWEMYERLDFDSGFAEMKDMDQKKKAVYHAWLDAKINIFRKRKERKGKVKKDA